MIKLKVKNYNEDEIVNLFGDGESKRFYKARGKLPDVKLKAIYKTLSEYCEFEHDKTDHIFKISEVFELQRDIVYNSMHRGIYKYIIPLLIKNVISGHNKKNKNIVTTLDIAKAIGIINDSFNKLYYNNEDLNTYFWPDDCAADTFIQRSMNMMQYYINKALLYLEEKNCVFIGKSYTIKCIEENEIIFRGEKRKINKVVTRPAKKEEIEMYCEMVDEASEKTGCNTLKEQWFGPDSKCYITYLNKLLKKKNILTFYSAYELYTVKPTICEKILNSYLDERGLDYIKTNITKEFFNLLLDKTYEDDNDEFEQYAINQGILAKIMMNDDLYELERMIDVSADKHPCMGYDIEGAKKGTIGW